MYGKLLLPPPPPAPPASMGLEALKRDVTNENGLGREVGFSSRFCFGVVTWDKLFPSNFLGLKYKVVLQLYRLCLLANFPASTITIGAESSFR